MRAVTAFSLLLLIAPTLFVVIASFSGEMTLRFPPRSYSLQWYSELWTSSPQIVRAAAESLRVATFATLICVSLGTLAALAIARSRSRLAVALDAFFMSPLILPTMAFGLALLLMFSVMGVRLSSWTPWLPATLSSSRHS